MDNIYVQIIGVKDVIMWSPDQALNLYLDGDKSKVIDLNDPLLDEKFPKFNSASKHLGRLYSGHNMASFAIYNLYNNFPNSVCVSECPNFFISQRISKISISMESIAHRGLPKISQCMIKAEIRNFREKAANKHNKSNMKVPTWLVAV